MSDEVISDNEDWGDENDVVAEHEDDKKRRKERIGEYGDDVVGIIADGSGMGRRGRPKGTPLAKKGAKQKETRIKKHSKPSEIL